MTGQPDRLLGGPYIEHAAFTESAKIFLKESANILHLVIDNLTNIVSSNSKLTRLINNTEYPYKLEGLSYQFAESPWIMIITKPTNPNRLSLVAKGRISESTSESATEFSEADYEQLILETQLNISDRKPTPDNIGQIPTLLEIAFKMVKDHKLFELISFSSFFENSENQITIKSIKKDKQTFKVNFPIKTNIKELLMSGMSLMTINNL